MVRRLEAEPGGPERGCALARIPETIGRIEHEGPRVVLAVREVLTVALMRVRRFVLVRRHGRGTGEQQRPDRRHPEEQPTKWSNLLRFHYVLPSPAAPATAPSSISWGSRTPALPSGNRARTASSMRVGSNAHPSRPTPIPNRSARTAIRLIPNSARRSAPPRPPLGSRA